MTAPKPTLAEALRQLADRLGPVVAVWQAQGVFGSVFRGEVAEARQALGALPSDAVERISVVAQMLARLAADVVEGRSAGG